MLTDFFVLTLFSLWQRKSLKINGIRMWVFFAFGPALFAGLTAVLAKCGIRETDSNVATEIRTIVVLAFSYLIFRERLSKRAAVGLGLIVVGTLAMLVKI